MTEPVRIGIVGCGSVLRNYGGRIRLLADRGLARAVVACDVDTGREAFVRDLVGSQRFSTDPRSVTEADDVDLVLVLTSPASHGEIAAAALEAGKHVLVEKPMAPTLEEARRLVELADAHSLALVCAPHVILSPTFQIMWKRLRRGDIGKVCLARARYGEAGLGWGSWRYDGPGGGPLFECGVYSLTALTGLLGPARRVTAMSGVAIPEREVSGERIAVRRPDTMQVLIDFGESSFASLTTGYTICEYRSPAIELYGSTGVLQMLGDDWAPEGYELWQEEDPVWRSYPDADPLWHWTEGLRHIVDHIRGGDRPLITPEHAYHVLEVMVRAEESAVDGRAREIESTFPEIAFDIEAIDVGRTKRHGRQLWGLDEALGTQWGTRSHPAGVR